MTTNAAGAVAVVLFVLAAVSIVRARSVGMIGKSVWALVVLVLPVIGPLLWFLVGARYRFGADGGNSSEPHRDRT